MFPADSVTAIEPATPEMPRYARWGLGAAALLWVSYVTAAGWPAELHNADSLIPVFVSLEGWSLFFWGQDRFGMLLPLLALPIRDGFWNLVVQNMLGTALLLAGIVASLIRCGASVPSVRALAVLSVLLAWPADDTALLLLTSNQSYAPALGLFGLAFYFSRHSRLLPPVGALLLMVAGAWTNAGVALLVAAMSGVGLLFPSLRRSCTPLLAGSIASLGCHRLLQGLTRSTLVDVTHLTLVPWAEAGGLFVTFWIDAYAQVLGPGAVFLLVAWCIAMVSNRTASAPARAVLLAVPAGVVAYCGAMMFLLGGVGRHFAPGLVVLLTLLCASIGRLQIAPARARLMATAMIVLVSLQAWPMRPQALRRQLVEDLGRGQAINLYGTQATVVTGDYWAVWPVTFAINLLHEQVAGGRPVLPAAMRAEDLLERRRTEIVPGTRVIVAPSGDRRYWDAHPELPALVHHSDVPGFEVLTVVGAARDEGSSTAWP